ncbi:MAG TPA: hypothetical protein VG267_07185 [Terracidiphilus sp.]|jgi:hypothetical protein|nr:hypothetical protein [Terracidiphilus sp.]
MIGLESHKTKPALIEALVPQAPALRVEESLVPNPEPLPPPAGTLAAWLPLLYMLAITAAELAFIEFYCHWHGAQFLLPNPFNLYSAENIAKLSKITFVSGSPPTTMDFTAEILMWASLGVWSQRIAGMNARYRRHVPNPPHDLAEYIGILGCHTSIAAAVMIVLKLSGFKIFSISLDSFEATAGTAFILGYFGKQTEQLFLRLRDMLLSRKNISTLGSQNNHRADSDH